jgi:hypothetical protein
MVFQQADSYLAELRALVAAHAPSSGREEPLTQSLHPVRAARLRERALPPYRAWLVANGSRPSRLSDDVVWEVFVQKTRLDFALADMGSLRHLDSLRALFGQMLGAEIAFPKVPGGPPSSTSP